MSSESVHNETVTHGNLDEHPRPSHNGGAAAPQALAAAPVDQHPRPREDAESITTVAAASVSALRPPAPTGDGAAFAARAAAPLFAAYTADGSNGDEALYPNRIGNFHKGLHHDANGEVIASDYDAFLEAVHSGKPSDFDAIPLDLGRKWTNPQSGLADDTEGGDPQGHTMPPAPALASPEAAGEAVELYWMALLRDVPFTDFAANADVAAAVTDLNNLTDFRGPRQGGVVTPATIFRGSFAGDLSGPYLSQFLLRDIPYGSLTISQRQETVLPGTASDYMTTFADWLHIQNGGGAGPDKIDPTRRYIRNMRDLAHYVHVDALYEAYLNACLILLGLNAPVDEGNPYNNNYTQIGFGTFGGPHILSLVCEVATRALKAVWYQKWFVHRRLRPEAYGGLVHLTKAGTQSYPVDADVLNSDAVARTSARYGTCLLPMAFPEGSPTHPAYGAGHATVAGACVTILKAWFDELAVIPNPRVPNAAGTALVNYTGPDAGALTVGGELNKVAANIAIGRNMAGVHWRTDYLESLRLGEQVAICILKDQSVYYNEDDPSFTFTTFDGVRLTVRDGKVTDPGGNRRNHSC